MQGKCRQTDFGALVPKSVAEGAWDDGAPVLFDQDLTATHTNSFEHVQCDNTGKISRGGIAPGARQQEE